MEEELLQLLQRILLATDGQQELLLQQNVTVLPHLTDLAERLAGEQLALAPYLFSLVEKLRTRSIQNVSNASSASLLNTLSSALEISDIKAILLNLTEDKLHWATLTHTQPPIEENQMADLNRTPQSVPRLLRLTVDGQKVQLADNVNTIEADFTLPPLWAIKRVQELVTKKRLDDANEENELLELGRTLYQHLLPGAVGTTFEAIWNEGESVQLHLKLNSPKLQAIPWEYLANSDGFLSKELDFIISRHIEPEVKKPKEVTLALPLRLLVVVSSPLDLKPERQLDADREVSFIRRSTQEMVKAGDLEIEVEDIASLQQLRTTFESYKPHLVHFTGHGVVENDAQGNVIRTGLLLENAEGTKTVVTAPDLAKFFENRPELRAIVLSACVTAVAETKQAIESIAAQLVKAGVPAVIAMQESILDESATLFAQNFYPALAKGQPIGKALAMARRALYEQDKADRKNSDWGMPTLLTEQPDFNPFVFDKRTTPRPLAALSGAGLSVLSNGQGYFVGRQIEQRKLREVLTGDKAKLAIVYGLGGFGKSTLAQRMIERTLTRFKLVHTISCKSWQGLDFAMSGLADAFASVGYTRLKELLADKERRFTPEEYGQEVVKGLNELPALLVLDNFEDLLSWQTQEDAANATLKPTEAAVSEWLEAMLLAPGRGRILVTSRYNFVFTHTERHSQAIERIALDRLGYVEAIRLMGEYSELAKVPIEERLELWKQGIDSPQVIEWADAQRRQAGGLEGQNALLALHGKFTSEMLLTDLYAGLPENARVLLRRMAVYREALPIEFLNRQLTGSSKILRTLLDRQLLHITESRNSSDNPTNLYSQHQSVQLFGLERLKAEENQEGLIEAHHRAALHYEFFADYTSNNVSDYVSAKDHFLAARQLKEAVRLVRALNPGLDRLGYWREALILNRDLNQRWRNDTFTITSSSDLDLEDRADLLKSEADWMRRLGEVESAIPLYEEALEFVLQIQDGQGERAILGNLGNAYFNLGQYERAIEFYEKSLQIAQKIGERQGQGAAYGNLGNVYDSLGQYERAIEFYEKSLQIAQEIGDWQGQGAVYGNLGIAYLNLGQYERVIEFQRRRLQIAQEIGDRQGQGNAYGNLGNVYDSLGQYERAIEFHQKSLQIAQEIGDRQGQGAAYGNLGLAYLNLGQYEQAIKFHIQRLNIADQISDRQGQGNAYGNLGLVYFSLGQYERAIEFHQQHLQIAQEIGDRRGQGNAYGNLGIAYFSLGQYERAIEFYQQHLQVAVEISDQQGQRAAYGNLGITYDSLGQYERAVEFYQKSLQIAQEIGDRRGQGAAYGNLGNAYQSLGQYERAIEFHTLALRIDEEIGNRAGMGQNYGNLGITYHNMGQYERAIEFYQQCLRIAQEIGDREGQGNIYSNLAITHFVLEQYKETLDNGIRSLVILKEVYSPNFLRITNFLRIVRHEMGQETFEKTIEENSHRLGINYTQFREFLVENHVLVNISELNLAQKQLIYVFILAGLGVKEALDATQIWNEENRGKKEWLSLKTAVEHFLTGERSLQVLYDLAPELDELGHLILEKMLEVNNDPSALIIQEFIKPVDLAKYFSVLLSSSTENLMATLIAILDKMLNYDVNEDIVKLTVGFTVKCFRLWRQNKELDVVFSVYNSPVISQVVKKYSIEKCEMAKYFFEVAICFWEAKSVEQAVIAFHNARRNILTDNSCRSLLADVLANLGKLEYNTNKLDKALIHLKEALAIYTELHNFQYAEEMKQYIKRISPTINL
jgi:tetratricopeptide (TPR) repeat protein